MTIADPRYAVQSRFSDPGKYAELLSTTPSAIADISAVVRNTMAHYRTPGVEFSPEHLEEINNRWVEQILATDQARFAQSLDAPRPYERHVAGCCRDYTLLTVAALRTHGVPARSRIGFADYFFQDEGFHADHVIVDYWDGQRWVFADAQLYPEQGWDFDPLDMPRTVGDRPPGPFATAAQVWTAYRRGEIDDQRYGVHMELPFRGAPFIRDYVILELAHRQRDELLLWDRWGAMSENPVGEIDGDLGLIDELAALLLAADEGDQAAEAELEKRYAHDDRLHPGSTVVCISPTGTRSVVSV